MSQDTWPNDASAELADLAGRRDALRQAAELPGADPRALLEAAFADLDAAVEVLAKLIQADAGEPDSAAGHPDPPASLSAERSLLRAVFQQAPVPLFLLEPDGTIRRANNRAGDLIGAPPGYATGKPLTAFVDLPSRAAVQSQLAAATRTGAARQADCTLLGPNGPVAATLSWPGRCAASTPGPHGWPTNWPARPATPRRRPPAWSRAWSPASVLTTCATT